MNMAYKKKDIKSNDSSYLFFFVLLHVQIIPNPKNYK